MMRFLLTTLFVAALVLPASSAQTDGCLQTNPCEFYVGVDADGISSVSITNMTSGDWFILRVSSFDDRTHTVSFAGVQLTVSAFEYVSSNPFQAPSPGMHLLTDQPTGDQAPIQVFAGDVVDAENKAASKGAPGLPLAFLAAGLALAVLVRRKH